MKNTKTLITEGPRPFVTKLIVRNYYDIINTWESRRHRKGLEATFLKDFKSVRIAFSNGFKKVATLNWWISILFAFGASLFMFGSILSLWTRLALFLNLNPTEVNFVFFLGSIPFTSAAFLQLLQTYLASKKLLKSIKSHSERKGYNLSSLGYLSALFQFVGTLLFNVNTYNATKSNLSTSQSDVWIWTPDVVGSIFFLISGYLAFIEVGHSYWKWETKNMSWWVVFINLIGCIAFMTSAIFAFIPQGGANNFSLEISLLFTLTGAFCFFIGALTMLPEMGVEKIKPRDDVNSTNIN
ncbi:hypothetical protein [Bizionia arctica]|uniref:YrhK domain-containing protein n=1 Tax=Bizionia arctica TaxID=1495645 RepID=A0A917GT36_9FLAO|nr:hypothetical protein [Bizionia arctica]GGG55569.1 hypothetical protein GCM10010976_28050 [Bizionia arctica]